MHEGMQFLKEGGSVGSLSIGNTMIASCVAYMTGPSHNTKSQDIGNTKVVLCEPNVPALTHDGHVTKGYILV